MCSNCAGDYENPDMTAEDYAKPDPDDMPLPPRPFALGNKQTFIELMDWHNRRMELLEKRRP